MYVFLFLFVEEMDASYLWKLKKHIKIVGNPTLVREMFQGWINYGDYLIGHLQSNKTTKTCKYAVSKTLVLFNNKPAAIYVF